MGIYIKDFEMPKSCLECDCELAYMVQCKYWTGIESEGCPLVEVAETHGRLIDADALVNTVVFHTNIPADIKEFIEDLIEIAPTVIDEEGKQ